MMGKTHALTGWCAGLSYAQVAGMGLGQALLFSAATTGAALIPDIDTLQSTISHSAGPITRQVSRGMQHLSATVYRATRTPQDGRGKGTHRFLTHTLLFAVVLGGLVAAGTALGGWPAVLVTALLSVLLAVKALGWWVLMATVVGGCIIAVDDNPLELVEGMSVILGVAVALGCTVHIAGDWLTKEPVPAFAPLVKIRGKRWYPCNPPAWMRFRTGGKVEKALFAGFAVAGVLLIPGLAAILAEIVTIPFTAA